MIPGLRKAGLALALATVCAASRAGEVRRSLAIVPGTQAESALLMTEEDRSRLETDARLADAGGGWAYRLPTLPGAVCSLRCRAEGVLAVTVAGPDGRRLTVSTQATADGLTASVRTRAGDPLGGKLIFRFRAGQAGSVFRGAIYTAAAPDRNGNGVADCLDDALWPGRTVARAPRPSKPMTSFQTAGPYDPAHAVTADSVLVYSAARDVLAGWADAGYTVYTMGGFREGAQYVKEHPGEVQTDREGRSLVIGESSFYMVPTPERNAMSAAYYTDAVANGAVGVCPEEPEMFARAGYSEAFKAEWRAAYGSPWVPPHSDVRARYMAERLKAKLTVRQVETILSAVAAKHPGARRLLAVHSPVTYSHWGIVMPHHALFRLPGVQEVIGQVWTGTARTANRVAGVRAERTFHLAYLEYSSLVCLLRGLAKPLWMLMDPLEDNPERAMEDYRRNYAETLVASFMFPTADRFEVMPWPSRIYGRVPQDFATVVNSVVGALSDAWRFSAAEVQAGTQGIATLTADSLAFQRGDPSPSDFDGLYGLSLPLIGHGIPLDALSLDRCADPGYLTGTKLLLASYDYLKPDSARCNAGIADWVRRGGVLMLFGGTDPYDALPDSWWRTAGLASPLDDLFRQLGIEPQRLTSGGLTPAPAPKATELLRGDGGERKLANRRRYAADLTPLTRQSGSVCVRFGDVAPEDGWGPYVTAVELRIRDRLAASFRAGSEMETRFLATDQGSSVNGEGRFADGRAYWEYRFDNLPRDAPVTLIAEMGNGFLVSAYVPTSAAPVLECTDRTADPTLRAIKMVGGYALTSYAAPEGAVVLYRRATDGLPAAWHAKVGNGVVFFCGTPPGFLTATAQADRWMRDLVRRGCAAAGIPCEPATAFIARKGPYVAVRALRKATDLAGRYVDLLDPNLPVTDDPQIPAGKAAFLKDVGGVNVPGLMALSGRPDAVSEGVSATSFVTRGPEGTIGVARLASGLRTVAGVKAWDSWGRPTAVTARASNGTVLLRYTNSAEGVAMKVVWK